MEQDRVIYSFPKNEQEEVRFTLRSYKDRQYLDLRLWFQPSSGGDLRPTKKGLTLGLEYLSELKRGIDRSLKLGPEMALQESANPVK